MYQGSALPCHVLLRRCKSCAACTEASSVYMKVQTNTKTRARQTSASQVGPRTVLLCGVRDCSGVDRQTQHDRGHLSALLPRRHQLVLSTPPHHKSTNHRLAIRADSPSNTAFKTSRMLIASRSHSRHAHAWQKQETGTHHTSLEGSHDRTPRVTRLAGVPHTRTHPSPQHHRCTTFRGTKPATSHPPLTQT